MVNIRKSLRREVLSKVSSNERQREEDDGDGGELLHALVLVGRDGVEDEVDEVVTRLLALMQSFSNDDAVIQHVTQIRVRHWRDDDAAGRVLKLLDGLFVREVRFVIAQHIDEVINWVEKAQHLVYLTDANVQTLALLDARGGQDVELQIAQDVIVHSRERDGQVDDGIDDGLHDERGVARLAQDGARVAETRDDGALNVAGGDLEEGDDGVVGREEDGHLLSGDGEVEGREDGICFHVVGARLVARGVVPLQGANHGSFLQLEAL